MGSVHLLHLAFSALSGRQEGKSTKFRPPPLNTSCWFHLEEGNRGTLQFPIVSEGVAIEGIQPATGAGAPAEGIPAHKIPGHIKYNDPREELASIQDDPAAVRDVIVAKFFDVYGRAPAEMVSLLGTTFLYMHQRNESKERALTGTSWQDYQVGSLISVVDV